VQLIFIRKINCAVTHLNRTLETKVGTQMNTRLIMAKAVRAHKPFVRGNISAILSIHHITIQIGQLPSFLADQLRARINQQDVYIVYSWQTPIGWCNTSEPEDWFIPDITYSKSTTHHQALLRLMTKYPDMYA
jgi:hypothetical protein